jgi:hypothetical protein
LVAVLPKTFLASGDNKRSAIDLKNSHLVLTPAWDPVPENLACSNNRYVIDYFGAIVHY